jgi:PAS domain S-box-containing protein
VLKAPIAVDDKKRLKKLAEYAILDTEVEDIFEEITISAAAICDANISAISLIDKDRQWFKSIQGLDVKETPRDVSFCGHAIMNDEIFIIEDSADDVRFCDNPLFLNEPHVRFYAGAPLITPEGYRVGTLCVIDSEKKKLTESQKKVLISLSKQVVNYLELRIKNKKLEAIQYEYEQVQFISKTGHWELDLETNITSWSKEVYKIYGLDESNSVSKVDALSYYGKDDQKQLSKMIDDAVKNKKEFVGDFSFTDDKGNSKWVRSAGYPILSSEGHVIRLVGTFQDITDIKNVLIKEKVIFDQSFDSIMTLEPPLWRFTSANAAAVKLFKTESESKFLDLGPWDISPNYQPNGILSSEKAKEHITLAMENGSALFDWQHQDLEGTKLDCTVLLSKVTIEGKDFLQATVRDVSDVKAHERDNQYILESMKVGTWKWDIIKDHLVWNDSNYNVFNINKNDFNSAYEAWEKTIHPEYKAEVVSVLEAALINLDEYNATFPILLKDNEIRYISAKAEIIRNEKGDAVQMIGINWDSTREYQITQELEKEKKSSYHSSKLASLGELAAGVGHEINNPMAIISGHCSIILRLLRQDRIEQIPKSIDIMSTAIKRVTKIVKGLKVFSRADSGENEHFNFSSAILETVEMIQDIYNKEGISITMDIVDTSIVWGNRGRLQQVLVNLLSNAKDALETVENKNIDIKVIEAANKYRVSVTDTGEGIPDSIIDKIFDPFYTSKEVNKGTGIGLSLCHRIICEHNGDLKVETKEGVGSTFLFDLEKVTEDVDIVESPVQGSIVISAPKKTNGHVLIVDDEEEVRKLLEIFTAEIGLTSDNASNGKEALEMFLKDPSKYDYIISDMKMPVMDGSTFFKEIRSRKNIKQPRLFIITGGVNIDYEGKDSEIGKIIDGHFTKPFSIEAIQKKLNEFKKED